jgi:hypothetical protein
LQCPLRTGIPPERNGDRSQDELLLERLTAALAHSNAPLIRHPYSLHIHVPAPSFGSVVAIAAKRCL